MFSKVAVLFAVFAAVSAGIVPGAAVGGHSVSSRRQDDFGNYAFNYNIVNGVGATNGRSEVGDGWGNKRGSYVIGDIDGRARRVEYVADAAGFRAVKSRIDLGAVVAHAPVAVAAAPVAAVAAPVAAFGYKGVVGAPFGAYGAYGAYGAPVAAFGYKG
ncbi:adult-specific rigid cuticular protein 15.7-like [Centruroides sculpturatus]|uniref:adult-specific rigid cuticular protein 15.7-like n=1 Tax=Centruroides sculpturatus TaxID=218467 RepID=UPI000C6C9006|nr:adult-specific rigid cuticular protein 15.7-like [Centruroides sculpturatus]